MQLTLCLEQFAFVLETLQAFKTSLLIDRVETVDLSLKELCQSWTDLLPKPTQRL
jgi:hypothetical protein